MEVEIWFFSDTVEWFFRLATSAVAHGGFSSFGTILIPSSAALASTAVAVVSVLIANRAKNIAEASEKARVDAENTRTRRDQQQRLDSAIRDLFIGIASLIRDIELYENNMREWSRANAKQTMTIDAGSVIPPKPAAPSEMALLALVAAARLEAAASDEREMLKAVRKSIIGMRGMEQRMKKGPLANLWQRVVDWRHALPENRPAELERILAVAKGKDATKK